MPVGILMSTTDSAAAPMSDVAGVTDRTWFEKDPVCVRVCVCMNICVYEFVGVEREKATCA